MPRDEVGRQAVELVRARNREPAAALADVAHVVGHQHGQFFTQSLQTHPRRVGAIHTEAPQLTNRPIDVVARVRISAIDTHLLQRTEHVRP